MPHTIPLANSLHRATLDALRRQAPFSAMAEDQLLWLVQRLSVAYFARDAVLLQPADTAPDALFIIKQGTVAGATAEGQTVLQLTGGEMFPLGALLAGRGAANRYSAATDTSATCCRLPTGCGSRWHSSSAICAACMDWFAELKQRGFSLTGRGQTG